MLEDVAAVEVAVLVPQRQRKSDIHYHCQADNLGRAIEIAEWIAHCRRLRNLAGTLKPIYSDNAMQLLVRQLEEFDRIPEPALSTPSRRGNPFDEATDATEH